MRRRDFIGLAAGSVAATPLLAARAQQASRPVIGYLSFAEIEGLPAQINGFRKGLGAEGFFEGQNVTIEYRSADGRSEALPELADDLVARKVALIASTGDAPTQAAMKATANIPIVFSVGSDPVAQGLVASLNRPGGNLTGVTNLNVELGPKRIEVMHELLPKGARIALLVNPGSSFTPAAIRDATIAVKRLGRELNVVEARSVAEIEAALSRMAQERVGGLVIGADAFFNNNSVRLATLALQHRLPAIYSHRDFSSASGLVSYGTDLKDLYRQQGLYAARVLKGEAPATLPVQQAARIEMIVNLKTAAVLGITVPQHLLARADEVIE